MCERVNKEGFGLYRRWPLGEGGIKWQGNQPTLFSYLLVFPIPDWKYMVELLNNCVTEEIIKSPFSFNLQLALFMCL